MFSKNFINLLAIIAIISVTIFSYANGLLGGYLFDDIPNLKNINVFSRFDGLDALIRYILSYESGILKRPISTLSFLLNSTSFTANAFYFKLTNLIIHIINGLLLYLVTFKIFKALQYNNNEVHFIAIANMAIWVLHPYFVSTTLYVIQRMAMLPVTFTLIGIYYYIKGRCLPKEKEKLATFYIIFSIYFCTILATLSKENGILLPFLILLLEKLIIKDSTKNPLLKFQKLIILFPIIIILIAFIIKIPTFILAYEERSFTIVERLMTESRVLIHYLSHLFIPRFESPGVFADGFNISTSFWNPFTTFLSIVAISLVLFINLKFRKNNPIISFAIFFYFIAHIIESTFIGLEIYFEHRNYLPSLFLFLIIPLMIIKFFKRYNIYIFLLVIFIIYLANTTYRKSLIWSDTTELIFHASKSNPKSIRVINEQARIHIQNNNINLAMKLLEDSINEFPDTSLRINLLNLKCFNKTANLNDFNNLFTYVNEKKYTKHDAESIAGFLKILINDTCLNNNFELAKQFIIILKKQSSYKITKINKVILSSEVYLNIASSNYNLISDKIIIYLNMYFDFNDVSIMINQLIEHKEYDSASIVINYLEKLLLLKRFKYTDRNYLETISIMRNKLK